MRYSARSQHIPYSSRLFPFCFDLCPAMVAIGMLCEKLAHLYHLSDGTIKLSPTITIDCHRDALQEASPSLTTQRCCHHVLAHVQGWIPLRCSAKDPTVSSSSKLLSLASGPWLYWDTVEMLCMKTLNLFRLGAVTISFRPMVLVAYH